MVNRKVLIPIGVALVSVGALGATALAKVDNGHSLVDMLAQKFNLNKADVQKVFDDHKSLVQADQEKNYEARLQKAVDDKKLTSDQRDKILQKHKDLLAQVQAMRSADSSKTPAERRADMAKIRTDITKWEQDNNIPPGYLGVMGGGRGHGNRNSSVNSSPATGTSTTTGDAGPDATVLN